MFIRKYPCLILLLFFSIFSVHLLAETKFHAVFQRVFDNDPNELNIHKAVLSKNGEIVLFYGTDNEHRTYIGQGHGRSYL